MNLLVLVLLFLIGCPSKDHEEEHQEFLLASDCNVDKMPGDLKGFLKRCGAQLREWGVDLKLNGDILEGPGGSFKIHHFKNRVDADIYINLADIEHAKIISDAYFQYLASDLNSNDEADMGKIIGQFSIFFGAQKIKSNKLLKQIIQTQPEFFSRHGGEKFEHAWVQFLDQVKKKQRDLLSNSHHGNYGTSYVAVITGPHGGGHLSTANEVTAAINEQTPAFEAKLFDECQDFIDPLEKLTHGKISSCKAFGEYWLKENNPRKAKIVFHLNWLVSFYVVPDQRGNLRKAIAYYDPDLIISTVHHINDISGLGYALEKPTLIAITDFDFPENQWNMLDLIDARYTRYLTPRTDKLFFRRMFNTNRPPVVLANQQARRSQVLFDEFYRYHKSNDLRELLLTRPELDVFRIVGYPVNPLVTYPADEQDVLHAKKELDLNLDPERKIVTISLGGAPSKDKIESLLGSILHRKDRLVSPIQIVVLTSGNKLISDVAESLFKREHIADSHGKIIAKIMPRLDRKEIAALNKASDLFLSKAGGATSAELFQASTYYLRAFGIETWEVENAIYLERLGLSVKTQASDDNTLDVNYTPYLVDPTGDELVRDMNIILSKHRILGSTPKHYIQYHRADLLREIKKMIQEF